MDAFLKAECHEHSAYLTTARGDVYRLWFEGEYTPRIQRLTDDQVLRLEAMRRLTEKEYRPCK